MIRLSVDRLAPDPAAIERAAQVIRGGGVVAMPTDTLYGLAADPTSETGLQKLFAVKGRAVERAVPLVAADIGQIEGVVGSLPAIARKLGERFWPGPLTLLIEVRGPTTLRVSPGGALGRIGVRVPSHAVTRAVCRGVGGLVTATSANVSGRPAASTADEVAETLGDAVDLLLDAGPTKGGAPSSIVDVARTPPRLVRAGAISWEAIRKCLEE